MVSPKKNAISPTRKENYPDWYQQVIKAADLAENSPVRGCMVIKPLGYAIWENMQQCLDKKFKATGHQNAYFPLLIPLEYLQKEAEHVDGFAKECAVVTHSRLEMQNGSLQPAAKLEDPYIIRPTSETIIGIQFAKWVQSYRDLPLKINQWANVMRWEMRTRLFLRTSEFLWQEGHTAHATKEEAVLETKQMLEIYAEFVRDKLAIPVICGEKTCEERFPGAENTYAIEALMQDGKALQLGTSHFLGQNFAKSFAIKFSDKDGQEQFAWTTSWGVSTRMIGGLIMAHSDDDGLVLPPRIAPIHIEIIPIYKNSDEENQVLEFCKNLACQLSEILYQEQKITVHIDNRDLRSGERSWQAIKKGTPIRLEIGPRDIANDSVFLGRRDLSASEKIAIKREQLLNSITDLLEDIQNNIFNLAKKRQSEKTKEIYSLNEFLSYFKEANPGFAYVYSSCKEEIQDIIKPLKVTARCIPFNNEITSGTCIFTGEKTNTRVLFAKAY